MTGGKEKPAYAIPEETIEWLESVRVIWHENPYVCAVPHEINGKIELMSYSAEYLKNTPLEEIKRGLAEHINGLSHVRRGKSKKSNRVRIPLPSVLPD